MAREGSFCLVRNGSPSGHCVPETMLTFGPATGATGACANVEATNNREQTIMEAARPQTTDSVFIPTPNSCSCLLERARFAEHGAGRETHDHAPLSPHRLDRYVGAPYAAIAVATPTA